MPATKLPVRVAVPVVPEPVAFSVRFLSAPDVGAVHEIVGYVESVASVAVILILTPVAPLTSVTA